ncbi:hypothetical protein TREMEDRAFT_44659 [Tremella mesenterica DSM 1558]|uniref:uncharacterized protein n=1 Tax=Tremella mesenterica (strain ATCC 24925 / CBS 8224 / DSM 1558 / NBRC 9311 / NRRL Y-6157 / RJB 2259-6 / UBC 559-6) TaxID=578456 RepID=UPI0003F49254|nr:uncharacterized protein TREMEDRAFT_44659 [Tremella mesenterica DSM 1558]EIW68224.1 hypothetical protein TREMEDRAFT_44659 [Tremella mesenterica DSM 1558]
MSLSTKSSKSPPPLPDDHESPPGPMGSASGVNDEDERIGEIGDDTDQSKGSDLNPSAEEPRSARDKGKGKVQNSLGGRIDEKENKNTNDGTEEEAEDDEDDDDDDEDGESDEQEERGHEEEEDGDEEQKGDDEEQPWQAVWSAEHNAWYFWNSQNGQVTWTNPLSPPTSNPPLPNEPPPLPNEPLPSNPPLPHPSLAYPSQAETSTENNPAGQSGIDPALAYLLPPEQRGAGLSQNDAAAQKGLFNARTGRFTKADYQYNVDHLDEYNRAKRMSSHYFDVEAWERQKSEEHEKRKRDEDMGTSSKRKITKKDMDRFRKKKAEQRARSQAWLRD